MASQEEPNQTNTAENIQGAVQHSSAPANGDKPNIPDPSHIMEPAPVQGVLPGDDIPPAAQESKEEFPSELRMGLAMSGGIALVLYQSGAAHEALRFMRAWSEPEKIEITMADEAGNLHVKEVKNPRYSQAYAQAFQTVPFRPVIDIVTGASAGGINCILLGHCLATGKTFDGFHDAWIVGADVANMQYGPGQPPKSLLNRDPLIDRVRDILFVLPNDDDRSRQDASLDLITRLCRTDYRGHCLNTTDAIGHSLSVQTQASVVGFGIQDFEVANDTTNPRRKQTIEDHLRAGESTSAFPGAFSPVEDPVGSGKWYIDGGLWNNQPLDLAVQAVHDKPAFSRTHRCILVIQPDPLIVEDNKSHGPEPPVADILASIPLMGLNGNLWPAIQNVLDFNQRSQLYKRLLDDPVVFGPLESYGGKQLEVSLVQLNAAASTVGGLLGDGALLPPPTLLNQVRIEALLFDNDPALVQRWNSLLARLGYREDDPKQSNPHARKAIATALHALSVIGNYDLVRRAVRRKLEVANAELLQHDNKLAPAEKRDLRKETANEKAVLYAQLEILGHYLCCGPDEKDCLDAPGQDVSAFQEDILDPHSRFRKPSREMLDAAELLMKQTNTWTLVEDGTPQGLDAIFDSWLEATKAAALIAQVHVDISHLDDYSVRIRKLNVFRAWPADKREDLAAVIGNRSFPIPENIDYARHILAAISDLTGKDPIDLVRISPNDTKNLNLIGKDEPDALNDPDAPSLSKIKLAGEQLGHFSGFLQERWRRNDYIWARLDTAEVFLRTLQTVGAREDHILPESEYERLLMVVQTEILREEAQLWNDQQKKEAIAVQSVGGVLRGKSDPAVVRANVRLIGYGTEGIPDADEPQFTKNLQYLTNTAIRVARGSAEKTPAELSVFERGMRLISYLVLWITSLMPRRRQVRSVFPILAAVLVVAGLLVGAGFMLGSKMQWGTIFTDGVIGLLLMALGCLLGFRWYVAIPLSVILGLWLGYEFGMKRIGEPSKLTWIMLGTLIIWVLTVGIIVWNSFGPGRLRTKKQRAISKQVNKPPQNAAPTSQNSDSHRTTVRLYLGTDDKAVSDEIFSDVEGVFKAIGAEIVESPPAEHGSWYKEWVVLIPGLKKFAPEPYKLIQKLMGLVRRVEVEQNPGQSEIDKLKWNTARLRALAEEAAENEKLFNKVEKLVKAMKPIAKFSRIFGNYVALKDPSFQAGEPVKYFLLTDDQLRDFEANPQELRDLESNPAKFATVLAKLGNDQTSEEVINNPNNVGLTKSEGGIGSLYLDRNGETGKGEDTNQIRLG
jgi:hypothetical protein